MTYKTLLHNRVILITRPREQAEKLADEITAYGGITLLMPTLEIMPLHNNQEIQTKLATLPSISYLIVTSANAVKFIGQRLTKALQDIRFQNMRSPCVIAIGSGTAAALSSYGIEVNKTPAISSSEGLLELSELHNVRREKILILTGKGGRDILKQALLDRGAEVEKLATYQREPSAISAEEAKYILSRHIDAIIATSIESLTQLVAIAKKAGQAIEHIQLVVLSQRIAEYAKAAHFSDVHITKSASMQDLLACLVQGFAHD